MITALKEFKNSFYEALDINKATLSGSRDIICVIQGDGSMKSTSFHVRFGKLRVLRPTEKIVNITINGKLQNIKMRLGRSGEGYFEEEKPKQTGSQKKRILASDNASPEFTINNPSDDNISDLEIQSGSASEEENDKAIINEQNKEINDINKEDKTVNKNEKSGWRLWGLFNREKKEQNKIIGSSQQNQEFTQNIIKESSMPEINIPIQLENKNDNKINEISKIQSTNEVNKQDLNEIKSEHLSRKNSIEEINPAKNNLIPPQQQKKGIITWFSEKLTKEKKENKNFLIVDEENRLTAKENIELNKTNDEKNENPSETLKNNENNFKEIISKELNENSQNLNESKAQSLADAKIIKDNKINYEEEENEEEDEEENSVELSICAHLINQKNEEDLTEIFNANKVTESQYFKDPIKILNNPNLMVKIEEHLYEWKIAEPLIIAKLVFHQDLPECVLRDVIKAKKDSGWKIFNWFSSGKSKKTNHTAQNPKKEEIITKSSPKESPQKEQTKNGLNNEVPSNKAKNNVRKTLKPNSEILKSFDLKLGKNTITYTIKTEYQGTSVLEAYIYVYNNNSKIVISDIDGTITKSDVLGQLMPIVGKKWCHEGVTKFFQNISKNGYQILYLTARAIGQSKQTRDFLKSVLLDDMNLPEGPVFMSPDRLLESFQREVIYKKPELFKIACLREIRSLFHQQEGLYAGFGNKDTDAIAYRSVGISMGKIFIINELSEIHQLNNTYLKSYPELNEMVDLIFPAINDLVTLAPEEYNDLNYWKIKIDTNIDFSKYL